LGRRLVISRTTLMTLILLPPTSVKVTVKSVFSSAGAAAPPPAPAGIAIGIAEAADTPSSDSSVFTSCESSRTVIPLMYSTTCCCVTSAILVSLFLYFALGPHPQRLCLRGSSPLGLACHDYPFSQQLRGPNPRPSSFAAHRRSALLVTTLRSVNNCVPQTPVPLPSRLIAARYRLSRLSPKNPPFYRRAPASRPRVLSS